MNNRDPKMRRRRGGVALRLSGLVLLTGLAPTVALAVQFSVSISDERVIVDDSDPRFVGAEIRAPQFCPYDTNWLSFEVRKEKAFYLYLYNRADARLTEILPGQNGQSTRIGGKNGSGGSIQNTDFDWRPEPGPGSARWFTFSSNVAGSFDIWLGDAVSGRTLRVPARDEAKNERGPKWSPDGELIAYWSDATFQGDIYLLRYVPDLLRTADTTKRLDPPVWLVKDPGLDYEIRWYPGKKSGYLAYTHQDLGAQQSRRVDIRICDIIDKRIDTIQNISPNTYLRSASWNPMGNGYLAFYQTDEYPAPGADVTWGVGVATVKMTDPAKGALELRVRRPARSTGEIEKSVQPSHDLRFGPAWTPDGGYLALTRHYEEIQNPVWLYEVRSWEYALPYQSAVSFAPAYKFPRDVTISGDQIAFVYTEGPSRRLLAARLKGDDFRVPKTGTVWPLVTQERSKRYDWMYSSENRPGLLPKVWHWASQPLFKPNVGLNTRGFAFAATVGAIVWAISGPPPPPPPGVWNPPGFGNH